jgi:hypothetical protein
MPVIVIDSEDGEDGEDGFYVKLLRQKFDLIEGFLREQLEARCQDNLSWPLGRSFLIPCVTENGPGVSATTLRRLFSTAALFHEKRPWETLPGSLPLVVTVPNSYDTTTENATRTYVCVLAGHGCWDARGVYLYNSWEDMVMNSESLTSNKEVDYHALNFFSRVMSPFQTLDNIDELGLVLPTNDGDDGDDSYPLLFNENKLFKQFMKGDYCKVGSRPLKPETIPSLTLAIEAITKFVSSQCANGESQGLIRMMHPEGPVPIHLEDNDGSSLFSAFVECRPFNLNESRKARYARFRSEEYMELMSVGDEKNCNFCQKPERIIRKEEGHGLLTCTLCGKIHYCSKRCQGGDWKRHKKMECSGNPRK